MIDVDYHFAHALIVKHSSAMEVAGTPIRCPICHSDDFAFTGVEYEFSRMVDRGAVPVAILVCNNCFNTLSFAWNGLISRYGEGSDE